MRTEPKPAGFRRALRITWSSRVGWLALGLAVAATIFVKLGSSSARERVIRATVGDARLRMTAGYGELIVGRLPPPPGGRIYELWIQRGTRPPTPSTLFGVTAAGTATLGLPSELTGVARVMVTVEPAGGSALPTTPAVIVASVAD